MMDSTELYEAYDEIRLAARNIGNRPFTLRELQNMAASLEAALAELEKADVTEYGALAQVYEVLERLQEGIAHDQFSKQRDEDRGFFLEQ